MNLDDTNTILVGIVKDEKKFSHEIYGESFFTFNVEVKRLSDEKDIIPVTASEVLIDSRFCIGAKVLVKGQFRSYNVIENEKNKLILTVFAKDIFYRQTPLGREITDLLLAVNRAYDKSDYIPAITWGRTARLCKNFDVGTEVKLTGRVQLREYEKKYEDGRTEMKTAYELSVMSLEKNS